MNTLHSYRRDYSHRRNERVGAKSEYEVHEAQGNLTKIAEDPDQCSKEPKANICLGRQAPVHPNAYYFPLYAIYVVIYLSVHLSF